MSRVCSICNKGPLNGNKVSHSNNKSKRLYMPNLQSVRASVDGQTKRIKVCTSCIQAGKVTKVA